MSVNSRASTPSDSETLPSYRTRETSPEFHGFDAHGLAELHNEQARQTHDCLLPAKRTITVNIKDANDTTGDGMTFTLGHTSTFKNVFNAFKAASCKSCRVADGIRFKVDAKRLKEKDTPESVRAP